MRVSLTISEPWEVGEAIHWHALPGELIKEETVNGRATVLLKLDEPINLGASRWLYVVVAPRHAGDFIAELRLGNKVSVSITGITAQQALSQNPCDLSGWRGGLGCVGEIESVAW